MLLLKDRLERVPIVSLQTGAPIAETDTFVIDPRQLKVVGFYCSGPRLDVTPAILNVSDIREIGNMGIIVDSADVLMSPDDLVRLREILDYNFRLENKHVVAESGKKLGTVANFALDSASLYVVKLHVRPGVWQSFTTAELLVDRSQIVQVTDDEIIVKNATIRDEKRAPAPRPVIDNPFRRAPVEGVAGHHAEE